MATLLQAHLLSERRAPRQVGLVRMELQALRWMLNLAQRVAMGLARWRATRLAQLLGTAAMRLAVVEAVAWRRRARRVEEARLLRLRATRYAM